MIYPTMILIAWLLGAVALIIAGGVFYGNGGAWLILIGAVMTAVFKYEGNTNDKGL